MKNETKKDRLIKEFAKYLIESGYVIAADLSIAGITFYEKGVNTYMIAEASCIRASVKYSNRKRGGGKYYNVTSDDMNATMVMGVK
jgi:hypothetical protein